MSRRRKLLRTNRSDSRDRVLGGMIRTEDQVSICAITPVLPTSKPAHAGGVYVWALDSVLRVNSRVHYLTPDQPSNQNAIREAEVDSFTLLRVDGGLAQRILRRVFSLIVRVDDQAPYLPVLPDLLRRESLQEVRSATVLDFQYAAWFHWSFLRIVNPRALIVYTYHDITSQIARRRAKSSVGWLATQRWHVSYCIARLAEMASLQFADRVVVLNEKDRQLLVGKKSNEKITVIDPPIVTSHETGGLYQPTKIAVLVGFFVREPNVEAAMWLAHEVWPRVLAQVPEAELRIAGGGMSADLRSFLESRDGITVLGFVDDLDEAYQNAHVALVPLLSGAGVKFKAIEPLVRGLPTVTTTVGAEGIGGSEVFSAVRDNPQEFAQAILKIFNDPIEARTKALASMRWAQNRYGLGNFEKRVRVVYGISSSADYAN